MKQKISIKKLVLVLLVGLFANVFAQTIVMDNPVKLDSETSVTIEAVLFDEIKTGDLIYITYKNAKADEQKLTISSGKGVAFKYGVIKGADSDRKGTYFPEKKSGTLSYSVPAREISLLKKEGLILSGEGLKITKVSFAPPPTPKVNPKKAKTPNIKVAANPKPVFEEGTPFAQHGTLKVDGAYLYDKNNNKYQLYGMSTHGLAWYPQYVNKESLKTLRDDWNTNCFRIAMYPRENGGYCAGGDKERLKNLVFKGIDAATELGMYVIVDWHVLNYNPNDLLDEAMLFLSEVSQKYAKYDNVIYELCNEPTGSPWDTAIKPYAENLIPMIRKNAPNSLIIVGTNTWSQELEGPLANPLKYKNVMYAFHFYADTHKQSFRDKVEMVITEGLPVFITEFGTCNSSGNGGFNVNQTNEWLDLIKEYNICHMNWSLANKAETASVILPDCTKTSDWSYSELTESGKLIYDHFNTLNK